MILWGKTMAEIDEDHRKMLAERLAREQNATPQQLGQHYGNALQPVRRTYHFGTDIPAPSWEEIEMERARHGEDDAGHAGRIMIWGLVAVLASVGFLVIVIAFK